MRHIFTVSIDTELERELDEYQKRMSFQTRSEGAIQLLKKGLRYDTEISNLLNEIKNLKSKPNEIHLPCSVCGKPMKIKETDDSSIYKDMKTTYKNWGHSTCIDAKNSEKKKQGDGKK